MATTNAKLKRKEVTFFEGVNTLVGDNISKKEELKHAENVRSIKIGLIEKRKGYKLLGNALASVANYGMSPFNDDNAISYGFYRVSKVGSVTSMYYLNTSNTWVALAGEGTSLAEEKAFFVEAEDSLFMVNGSDRNRYVESDGLTVVTSATGTGHLYNSPIAKKIAHYKERLYVGDYKIGTTEYKTGVMMSSKTLGIVALVDGDHASGVTKVEVTDTKYIHANSILQVYRGGTLITSLTVTDKKEYYLSVSVTGVALESADELWINGTYSGKRKFRWADNPQSGIDVKQYDTFKLSGSGNDALTILEPIGDILLMANKNNIGVWNDYNIKTFDLGIGCVSERGYVKALGLLFFIDYTGIYATSGDTPKLISSKIDEYINGATKAGLEASAMGKKRKSIFCTIGDVTLYKDDGSVRKVLSDVMLEYNMQQENWFIHTGIDATQFARYMETTDPDSLEFFGGVGNVYNMLDTTKDDEGVANKEIPFVATLTDITLCGEFDAYAYPKAIVLEVKRGHGIKCNISPDGAEFFPLEGEAKKGITRFPITKRADSGPEVKCRTISVSFREISISPVKLARMAIEYYETGDKDFDKTKI